MFGRRLTVIDLFGFRVRVDSSWLLLAALVVWSLAAGYFPTVAPGYSEAVYWGLGTLGLLGLAVSVVLHELAHALVARRYGIAIGGITLFLFGGVAEMQEEPRGAKGELMMALAGPAISVVIGLGCRTGGAAIVALGAAPDGPAAVVLAYLAFVNLLLAAFNMIPAFPLDGGRVLRAVLWAWTGNVLAATRVATGIGTLFAYALIVWGFYNAVTGNPLGGVWWFMIGLFVRAAAAQGYRQQLERQHRDESQGAGSVGRLMRAGPVAVEPGLPLDRLVDDIAHRHGQTFFPVVAEDGRLLGGIGLRAVTAVPRSQWPRRTVAETMEACTTIAETADAAEALDRMRVAGRPRLMVVRGERLVGMLTLDDLLERLSVRGEGAGGGLRKAS